MFVTELHFSGYDTEYFGHSCIYHLRGRCAWSGLCLPNLNRVTSGDLPARFDWSIIGWTILLLALMNLQKK